jgi:hypothetical protein
MLGEASEVQCDGVTLEARGGGSVLDGTRLLPRFRLMCHEAPT